MQTVELSPHLHQLLLDPGYAYLWCDADELTLIDTGVAGSGAAIAEAVRSLGRSPAELRRVVLTHFHQDHSGSAAEIRAWGGVQVLAHRLDAPVVRGETPGPAPVLTDAPEWEQQLFASLPVLPQAPPVAVDRELEHGDTIAFGGGARVVAVPGHTDGSIAIHLPDHGVVFTGDALANVGGRVTLGVFNLDRARAAGSLRRIAELDADTACFGHGEPIVGDAASSLRTAADEASTQ
jgi:glyoxylase-like metal-dependent hydrolase (beta-lactamase superfamily II)